VDQRTPNISSIIEEIVGRGDWASGNDLVIIIDGTGERQAESYEGATIDHSDASLAAYIHIEYSMRPAATTNYRSIGTNSGILYNTGNASIDIGTTTVTFGNGASLPAPDVVGAVGQGDKLIIGSETFYILSRDGDTHVTVQTPATSTHTNESYEIRRAYNDFQSWEDGQQGTGDLVGEDRIEVGVAYKDGVFAPPATITINGSENTDARHYMSLTVAPGQRHNGTAGTGVIVDGSSFSTFFVRDKYFRMEWLEIRNFFRSTTPGQPIIVNETNAGNNLLSHLIIHDYTSTDGVGVRGAINVYENATIRNCIIYNGDKGIRTYGAPDFTLTLQNVTIYNMTDTGVDHQDGTLIVNNTISVGTNRDFDVDNTPDGVVDPSSGYNMYATAGLRAPTTSPPLQAWRISLSPSPLAPRISILSRAATTLSIMG
jgi:hypothetical protein